MEPILPAFHVMDRFPARTSPYHNFKLYFSHRISFKCPYKGRAIGPRSEVVLTSHVHFEGLKFAMQLFGNLNTHSVLNKCYLQLNLKEGKTSFG